MVERQEGLPQEQNRRPEIKFSESANQVLSSAKEEALRLNHGSIGGKHLLLGLILDPIIRDTLSNSNIHVDRISSMVDFIVIRGEHIVSGDIGLTPRARKIINLAA